MACTCVCMHGCTRTNTERGTGRRAHTHTHKHTPACTLIHTHNPQSCVLETWRNTSISHLYASICKDLDRIVSQCHSWVIREWTSQPSMQYNYLQHNNLKLEYLAFHQERRAACTIVRNRLACLQPTVIVIKKKVAEIVPVKNWVF